MALHGQHIKGVTNSSNNTPVYTFLDFTNQSGSTTESTPSIWVSTENSSKTGTNLGHILTTDASNQIIYQPITFSNAHVTLITEKNVMQLEASRNDDGGGIFVSNKRINFGVADSKDNITNPQTVATFSMGDTDMGLTNDVSAKFKNVKINNKLLIKGKTELQDSLISTNYIQALYFNATSDKRAKENVLAFNCNALDIVKNLQVYTFNYLNCSERSIGIMAQDLANINIDGFSFVENPEATGEQHDYMSIRESKLVYLLLESIKELKTEVDELKAQLNK